jgi:hypothetical protein
MLNTSSRRKFYLVNVGKRQSCGRWSVIVVCRSRMRCRGKGTGCVLGSCGWAGSITWLHCASRMKCGCLRNARYYSWAAQLHHGFWRVHSCLKKVKFQLEITFLLDRFYYSIVGSCHRCWLQRWFSQWLRRFVLSEARNKTRDVSEDCSYLSSEQPSLRHWHSSNDMANMTHTI